MVGLVGVGVVGAEVFPLHRCLGNFVQTQCHKTMLYYNLIGDFSNSTFYPPSIADNIIL